MRKYVLVSGAVFYLQYLLFLDCFCNWMLAYIQSETSSSSEPYQKPTIYQTDLDYSLEIYKGNKFYTIWKFFSYWVSISVLRQLWKTQLSI